MLITEILEFSIFPGILFIIWISIIISWLMRKLVARMENRIGPPFNQPAYDVAKLFAKERIYPQGSIKWILRGMPRFQVMVALLISFFIPIIGTRGLISFDGDLYFFLFLVAVHGSTSFFVGWASRNPYTVSGSGRAVLTEISFEIPLSLSLAGMAIMTGSIQISEITQKFWSQILNINHEDFDMLNYLFLIPWVAMLITSVYSIIGALEINPFSAAHAETEIVGGWATELTGSDLGMVKLADMINLFNFTALLSSIFLGGPVIYDFGSSFLALLLSLTITLLIFGVKLIVIIFMIAFIATLSSRLRIDQITNTLWMVFLPISMISILLVILIKYLGG